MEIYINGGSMTKKSPWSEEEDSRLVHYINIHGEGRWDFLACTAGLERTGKSCRFRWLNYLRPGIRRGNFTIQEQIMILELHFQWGNRWSKIAQYLPGRTDNEIKNYWRTRVQKQAKHLKCGVNSKQFKETLRNVLLPRLVERIRATTTGPSSTATSTTTTTTTTESSTVAVDHCTDDVIINHDHDHDHQTEHEAATSDQMAVSSSPWDEWLQDINDITSPVLDVNGTSLQSQSHHNCSFSPANDDDDLMLDNLWNWNDEANFAPATMRSFSYSYI